MIVFLCLCVGLFILSGASAGVVWDFANLLGYCGLAALVYLAWESESPAKSPKVRLHSNFSLIVTLLVTLHILVLLISDEIVVEYLMLKAPVYMLVGIVAALLIGFVTLTSFPKMRLYTYQHFPGFRKYHLILSISIIVFSVWHIVGSGFYQNTPVRQSGLVLIALGLPLVGFFARRKWGNPISTTFVDSLPQADKQGVRSIAAAVVMSLVFALLKNL